MDNLNVSALSTGLRSATTTAATTAPHRVRKTILLLFFLNAQTGVATDQPYHVKKDGSIHRYRQGNRNALMEKIYVKSLLVAGTLTVSGSEVYHIGNHVKHFAGNFHGRLFFVNFRASDLELRADLSGSAMGLVASRQQRWPWQAGPS